MSAAIRDLPFEEVRQQTEELESMDAAVYELSRQIATSEEMRGRLWARYEELISGRNELRRRRARTALDRWQPPITFYGIDEDSSEGDQAV